MSEQASAMADLFNEEQRKRFAEKIGSHMMGLIEDSTIAAVNRNSIKDNCGFDTAIDRWCAALRLLSHPHPRIKGVEDLKEDEVTRIQQRRTRRPSIRELAKDVKSDRVLRDSLRGIPDFVNVNASHVDELLANGVVDTANWLKLMNNCGLEPDDMRSHPLFLVATGLTTAGHNAFFGTVKAQNLFNTDKHLPITRREALSSIDLMPQTVLTQALLASGVSRPETVRDHGFCPASRMRDDQGNAWVHVMTNQGVDLLAAMPPGPDKIEELLASFLRPAA